MLILPTAAALGAGAAVAVGSIPSSSGTYTGCYNTVPIDGTGPAGSTGPGFDGNFNSSEPYGALRLIDPSDTTATYDDDGTTGTATDVAHCEPNETTATWNEQGPPGTNGTNGKNGVNGVNGVNGANGANGQNGAAGSNGGWQADTNYGVTGGGGTGLYLKLSGIHGQTSAPITTVGTWNRVQNKAETRRLTEASRKPAGAGSFSSKTTTETGLIKIQSFSLGSETPVNAGSQISGASAGKVQIQSLAFTKNHDATSTTLYQDLVSSTLIKNAELLAVHDNGGVQQQEAEFEFTNLVIKSISENGNRETVTAVVAGIKTVLGSGKGKLVTAGWNRVKNIAGEQSLLPSASTQ